MQAKLDAINTVMQENLAGMRVVNQELRRAATRAQIFAGFMGPVMGAVNSISLTIVVGAAGILPSAPCQSIPGHTLQSGLSRETADLEN